MVERGAAGGSVSLARELRRYPAAIESDLLRLWGIDLLDLFREQNNVSPRRVLALLSTLGEHSAYVAAARGVPIDWDVDRYLRKQTVDTLNLLLYVTAKANGAKRVEKPKPVPAPSDQLGQRRATKRQGQNVFAAMAMRAMRGSPANSKEAGRG